MDWDLAIKRNSEALKGIIAALFVLLGLMAQTGWHGCRIPFTVPCCGCCIPQSLPCGVLLSSQRAGLS